MRKIQNESESFAVLITSGYYDIILWYECESERTPQRTNTSCVNKYRKSYKRLEISTKNVGKNLT